MGVSRYIVVSALVGLLAACSSTPKTEDGADLAKTEGEAKVEVKPDPAKEPLPICPQVAIVRELDTLLRTKDGVAYDEREAKPEALVNGAKMTRVKGDCTYRKDGVDAKFKLSLVAAKGALQEGLEASFPYFVAVVDPSGHVIDKVNYSAEIGFSSEKQTMDHDESLRAHIPLELKDRASGAAYQVLMGFQREK